MPVKIPLRILVTDPRFQADVDFMENIEKLRKQGHEVVIEDWLKYDFITGPNCWYSQTDLLGLFTRALEQARKVANADQTRVKQPAAKKGTARRTSASRTPAKRNRKATKGASVTANIFDSTPDDGVSQAD